MCLSIADFQIPLVYFFKLWEHHCLGHAGNSCCCFRLTGRLRLSRSSDDGHIWTPDELCAIQSHNVHAFFDSHVIGWCHLWCERIPRCHDERTVDVRPDIASFQIGIHARKWTRHPPYLHWCSSALLPLG